MFSPTVCADEPPGEYDSTETPTTQMITADSELIAEQDSNLTINCNHEHNGTVYQVTLEKMPHLQPWGIIGICKKDLDPVTEDYNDRGRVSCTDTLHVSLHLTGVVEEDGGFYRCTFKTDAGWQTTTVLVSVLPPGTKTRLNVVVGLMPGGRIGSENCLLSQSVVTDIMCTMKQCCDVNLKPFRGLHLQKPQHPVTSLKTFLLGRSFCGCECVSVCEQRANKESKSIYMSVSTSNHSVIISESTVKAAQIFFPGGFSLSLYMMYVYIGAGAAALVLLTVIIILTVRHR